MAMMTSFTLPSPSRASSCLTVPMWKELDDITNAYLDTVSLSDLLTGEKWRGNKNVDKS